MGNFSGTLRSNEVFSSLFNMILSQSVESSNISTVHSSLLDAARREASQYGDTILIYDTDVLKSNDWDETDTNILAMSRPLAPKCQALTLDHFRQVALTTDQYLSKRAWSTESAFSQFNSVMLGWIHETKRIYDATLYNSFIGTDASTLGKQTQTIALSGITDPEVEAKTIAQFIADLFVELSDVNRDYNDYGFLRSFDPADIKIVFNSKWINRIRKVDLPTIFHSEGLMGDKFGEEVLPARYFGAVNAAGGTTGATNTTIRSLIEKDYNTVAMDAAGYNPALHIFPADLIPANKAYGAGETYTEDPKVICKIISNNSVPFLSSFEVSTSFYNPKNLTTNNWLTYGFSTLEHLKGKPFITVKSN